MARFTEEQIQRANSVDIVSMLRQKGEHLKRVGREYRWMRHDSVTIRGNLWFRHSQEIGGGAIKFLQEFEGMSFREAVSTLLNGENGHIYELTSTKPPPKPVPFKLPKENKNMHRVFAYLIKTRCIDADVVEYFAKQKSIYESELHHNIVFKGCDKNGKARFAHLKGTDSSHSFMCDVEGSDKHFAFHHTGSNHILYVFEAPVDMLSFISLNKENWTENNYVTLGGVAEDAIIQMLDDNTKINHIYLCLDNDKAGRDTINRLIPTLKERECQYDILVPSFKDWNEDICAIKNRNEVSQYMEMG